MQNVLIQQAPPASPSSGPTLGTDTATTTGSSVSFTSIPATAKCITLSWRDGSINGTGTISVQIGDSGGLAATGYVGQRWQGSAGANPDTAAWSTGALWDTVIATEVVQMTATLTLVNSASNIWQVAITGSSETRYSVANGYKALSATLDRVALVTSQAFDAGSVNIAYH